MHEGVFGLSPFEVFFERKENENVEYTDNSLNYLKMDIIVNLFFRAYAYYSHY